MHGPWVELREGQGTLLVTEKKIAKVQKIIINEWILAENLIIIDEWLLIQIFKESQGIDTHETIIHKNQYSFL